MRLLPLMLLCACLVLAGCAKKNDSTDTGGTTPPTTSTPASGGTTPATTSTPTTTTGNSTNNTNTTPTTTPVAPKVIKSSSFAFPNDCNTPAMTGGAPSGACTPVSVTVDAGYTSLNLTVAWSCTVSPPCGSTGASVTAGSLACPAPQTISPADAVTTIKCSKIGTATPGTVKVTPVPDAAGMTATWTLSEM